MTLINTLLMPKQNSEEITFEFAKLLNIKVAESTIIREMEDHPDYSSLLSISDVLKNFGIENLALNVSRDKVDNLPTPCIAKIKDTANRNGLFAIVKEINDTSVSFYNPKTHKYENIGKAAFADIFMEIILIAEPAEGAGEQDYKKTIGLETKKKLLINLLLIAIPALVLISTGVTFYTKDLLTIATGLIFSLLTLTGFTISVLLLIYEIDQHNVTLREICYLGNKTNCAAILNSKASKIFGISWSIIGFSYFTGMLIATLTLGILNENIWYLIAWINVLALPYTIFSIYYQWRVAKEWCVLCVSVQAVLLLQFVTAFIGNFNAFYRINEIDLLSVYSVAICFLLPFVSSYLLLPRFKTLKEGKQTKLTFQNLKLNPDIFKTLLTKEEKVAVPADDLGITIGNPNAQHKIIKVCNPYCGPCATAHPILESLLNNNQDVSLQIIFTATTDEKDFRYPAVAHLMAIAEVKNGEHIHRALGDWYNAPKKDYPSFAKKYPMNGELKNQDKKIEAMREWCDLTKIKGTPTIFVNGHMLPDSYSVSDLKYFFSN